LHPFYRERFGTGPGLCPIGEAAYETILSLPMFPRLSDGDVAEVIRTLARIQGETPNPSTSRRPHGNAA
jgi:perosamine synthetase